MEKYLLATAKTLAVVVAVICLAYLIMAVRVGAHYYYPTGVYYGSR